MCHDCKSYILRNEYCAFSVPWSYFGIRESLILNKVISKPAMSFFLLKEKEKVYILGFEIQNSKVRLKYK